MSPQSPIIRVVIQQLFIFRWEQLCRIVTKVVQLLKNFFVVM